LDAIDGLWFMAEREVQEIPKKRFLVFKISAHFTAKIKDQPSGGMEICVHSPETSGWRLQIEGRDFAASNVGKIGL
jgi:hypothetical protein